MARNTEFAALAKHVAAVREQYDAARERIETLRREREDLIAAPAAADEIASFAGAFVDRAAAAYRAQLKEAVEILAKKPAELPQAFGAGRHSVSMARQAVLSLDPSNRLADTGAAAVGAVVLAVGAERIKQLLADEIAAAVPDGITSDERAERLERIDSDLKQAERELDNIRRAAADAGIFLEQ